MRPLPATAVISPAVSPPAETLEAALETALTESRLLACVARAAGSNSANDWRAAAWLLDRRYPERWATPMRTFPADPVDDGHEETVKRWLSLVPPTNS